MWKSLKLVYFSAVQLLVNFAIKYYLAFSFNINIEINVKQAVYF